MENQEKITAILIISYIALAAGLGILLIILHYIKRTFNLLKEVIGIKNKTQNRKSNGKTKSRTKRPKVR